MSTSIDNRIVEMQFRNSQFEAGAKKSMNTLNELKRSLNFSGVYTGLSGLQNGLNKLTHQFSFLGMYALRMKNQLITTFNQVGHEIFPKPQRSGLEEYETQIKSIQTILANTRFKGTTLKDVETALDELNVYADKTIYNFSEMTKNIGSFTAAGVELKPAVDGIKGLSNLAAMSGSTPQQTATAMYQLSQALASGTIRLMDWNSVANANMGGETFQEAIKETARAHGVSIDKIIKKNGTFRESLHEGWLTADIMLDTLRVFTGDLTDEQLRQMGFTEEQIPKLKELGQIALDSATKLRTFTQVIGNIREMMGSGWAQTWTIVIGDFEEATSLWTDIADTIGEVITETANKRNLLLQQWKDLGGREKLINGLMNSFKGLWGILMAVKEGFRDIFPPMTAEKLYGYSEAINVFGLKVQRLLRYTKGARVIYRTVSKNLDPTPIEEFSGELLKLGKKSEGVERLQERLKQLGYYTGAVDGIFGEQTLKAVKDFQKSVNLVVDGIYGKNTHASLSEALFGSNSTTSEVEVITESVYHLGRHLSHIKSIVRGVSNSFSLFIKALKGVGGFFLVLFNTFSPFIDVILTIGAAISECFISLNDSLDNSKWFADWLASINKYFAPLNKKVKIFSKTILSFLGLKDGVKDSNRELMTFSNLWATLKSKLEEAGVWDAIYGGYLKIKLAFAKLKESFVSLKNYLVGIFADGKDAISKGIKSLFEIDDSDTNTNKMSKIITAIGNWISNAVDFIATTVSYIPIVFDKIKAYIIDIIDWFKSIEGLDTAVENIKAFFKGIYDAICSFFAPDTKADDGNVNGASKQVKNTTDKVTKAVTEVKDNISFIETITNGIKNIWDKITGFFKGLYDKINNFFDSIGGIYGVILLFLYFFGGSLIFRVINKVIDVVGHFVTSIAKLGTNLSLFVNELVKQKRYENKRIRLEAWGELFKSIAILIYAIAGAIYIFGKMDKAVFKHGAIIVGSILAIIIGMAWGFTALSKIGNKDNLESLGKILLNVGLLFVTLSLAVKMVTSSIERLGKMTSDELGRGIGALFAIIFMLSAAVGTITFLLTKADMNPESYKTVKQYFKRVSRLFLSISLSVAILTTAILVMGNMDKGGLGRGIIGISALMLFLFLFARYVIKYAPYGMNNKKLGGISAMLLSIAHAISSLAFVVSFLGHMDWSNIFLPGLGKMALLMLALGGFVLALSAINKYFGANASVKGLLGISLAIGFIALIIKELAMLKPETFMRGGSRFGIILASIIIFITALSAITKFAGFRPSAAIVGLGSLIIAVGLIGIIINQLGNMKYKPFVRGVSRVVIILAGILMFLSSLNMYRGPSGQANAQITGLISLSASIALLAVSIKILSSFTWNEMAKGLAGLLGVILTLVMMIRFTKNANINGGVKMLLNCIGLAVLIGVFALALNSVKNVDPSVMLSFATSIALVIGALSALVFAMSKIGGMSMIKSSVSLGLSLGIITAAISGIVWSLGKLDASQNGSVSRNIERGAEILASVGNAISGMGTDLQVALGAIMGLSLLLGIKYGGTKFGGFKAIGISLAGDVIALFVTATFGAMTGIAGSFVDLAGRYADIDAIKKGGEVLGAISDALDKLSPELKIAFASILGLGEIAGVTTAIKGGSAIASTATGAAAKGGGYGLLKMAEGVGIGGAIALFIEFIGGIAITIAGAFLSFFGWLDTVGGEGALVKLINRGGEVLGSVGAALGKFFGGFAGGLTGGRLKSMNESLAEATEVEVDGEKVDKLLENLQKVQDLASGIGLVVTFEDFKSNWHEIFGGKSDFTKFCDALPRFTDSVEIASENIFELSKTTFVDDVDDAVSAAETIYDFASKIEEAATKDTDEWSSNFGSAAKYIKKGSAIDKFCQNLGTFADTIGKSRADLKGLKSDNLAEDAGTAVDLATKIADFMVLVKGMDIEKNKGFFEEIFTGDTTFNTVVGGIASLAASIKDARSDLKSADLDEGAVSDFETMLGIFRDVINTFSVPIMVDSGGNIVGETQFDPLAFSYMVDNIARVGADINTFMSETEGVDANRFAMLSTSLSDAMVGLNTLYRTVVDYSSAGSPTEIDVSKWFENLDADVALRNLTVFMETIGQNTRNTIDELKTYTDDFNSVGRQFAQSLSSGTNVNSNSKASDAGGFCKTILDACKLYIDDFEDVGSKFVSGLNKGIRDSRMMAVNSAAYVARSVVNKVKEVFDVHSPSRVAEKIGRFFDMGLGNGISDMAKYAVNRAEDMGNAISNATNNGMFSLTEAINNDLDSNPVIRPVVDLSDIKHSTKAINGMMSSKHALSLSTSSINANAIAKNSNKMSQNGKYHGSVDKSYTDNSAVNVTGNTFNVRSDQDVDNLASEIAALTRRQQRGYGAR